MLQRKLLKYLDHQELDQIIDPIVINKSSAILDFCSIIPIKINKGIAIRVSVSTSQ